MAFKNKIQAKSIISNAIRLSLAGFLLLIINNVNCYSKPFAIFVMGGVSGVLAIIVKKQKLVWRLFLATLAIVFVTKICLMVLFPVKAVSDFGVIMQASWQLSTGDSSYKNSDYFMTWGFNIGQVIYQAIVLKFFGSELSIQILNAIFDILSLFLGYLIAKKLYSGVAGSLTMMVLSGMFFVLTYSSIASNQHLFILIALGAVYYYLTISDRKSDNLKGFLGVGALLSVANIIRPESIVFVLAIVCDQFFGRRINRQAPKRTAGLVMSYLVVGGVLGQLAIFGGFSNIGFKSTDFWFKFRTGLNLSTLGNYSERDQQLLGQMVLKNKITMSQANRELLVSRLRDPGFNAKSFTRLAVKKIIAMWTGSRLYWFNDSGVMSKSTILTLERYDNFILAILAMLGLIGLYKSRLNIIHYSLFLTVAIYTLIEIQSRYALTSFYLMAILATGGIVNLQWLFLKISTKHQTQAHVIRVLITTKV